MAVPALRTATCYECEAEHDTRAMVRCGGCGEILCETCAAEHPLHAKAWDQREPLEKAPF
jgi:hypothetical protein